MSIFSLKSFSQDALLGEVKLFAGTYAPVDWLLCEGQELQISKYTALFAVIGTQYGGNGTSTFALPDLRDAVPIGVSKTRAQGSVLSENKINIDPTQSSTTLKTVALRYMICTNGIFPTRP